MGLVHALRCNPVLLVTREAKSVMLVQLHYFLNHRITYQLSYPCSRWLYGLSLQREP
jgi:hypothetical protein